MPVSNVSSLTIPEYVMAYMEAGTRAGTARILGRNERSLRRWVAERREEIDQVLKDKLHGGNVVEIMQDETYLNYTNKEHFKIAIVSDTHIGSKYQQITHLEDFYSYCKQQGITDVYHAGDLLAGVDVFPGQTRELFLHDFGEQVDYATERYPRREGIVTHVISGNHDMVFSKRKGGDPVQAISLRRDDIDYLGVYSAWIMLSEFTSMYLLHPDGGSAYASSYRLQKTIESFEGGRKPNILVLGHFHRRCYVVERNVHGLLGASFEAQTDFLKRKAVQPVIGGTILDITMDDNRRIHNVVIDFRQYAVPRERDY